MKLIIIKFALSLLSLLPLSVQHRLGRFVGNIVWQHCPRERQVTLINLALCFPEKPSKWHEKMAKSSLQHTGMALLETGAMWKWKQKKLCDLVLEVENANIFKDAIKQKKGVLLVSPHIGAWELIGTYVGSSQAMTTFFKPSRMAELNPLIQQARERFGQKIAAITPKGMRQTIKAIKDQQIIGILPDQEPRRENGVFAKFYNTPACTMTLLGKLASKNNTPVVYCVMERLDKGYKMHYLKADKALYDPNPLISAEANNRTIEACISIAPEQYIWSYKRFRLLENGQRRNYKKLELSD